MKTLISIIVFVVIFVIINGFFAYIQIDWVFGDSFTGVAVVIALIGAVAVYNIKPQKS